MESKGIMYYEYKIVDGQLMVRNEPRGEWKPIYNPVADAVNILSALTDDERLEVMRSFCHSCGCIEGDRPCQCWNDE